MHLNSAELTECHYSNRFRKRQAGEKLWLAGGLLVLCLALPPVPVALFIILFMPLLTLVVARVSAGLYVKLLIAPLSFAWLSAASLCVSLNVDNAGWALRWTSEDGAAALQVLARSCAAITCLAFLIVTTPFYELLALLRRAGVPSALCEMAMVMQRFSSVLVEAAQTMWQAQAARCGMASFARARVAFSLLTAQLFLRALQRARQCEIGLQARGYDGELRILANEQPHSVTAWLVIGLLHLSLLLMGWYVR